MEAKSELKYIFSNVNDWLKFAEAKHGGLIVLNTAMTVGLLSCFSNLHLLTYKPPTIAGGIAFGLSILFSLLSLFPVTQNSIFSRNKITNPNLYFFGHLAHIDEQTMIAELQSAEQSFKPTRFDIDLINQILVNARIANAKFIFFRLASYSTVIGAGIIAFSFLSKVIWHF